MSESVTPRCDTVHKLTFIRNTFFQDNKQFAAQSDYTFQIIVFLLQSPQKSCNTLELRFFVGNIAYTLPHSFVSVSNFLEM